MILERVPFVSTCEHHLAPFAGFATIGYLPGAGGTVGLSKLVRVVQGFANRLQVQERMTHQIADALETCLRPDAWGVTPGGGAHLHGAPGREDAGGAGDHRHAGRRLAEGPAAGVPGRPHRPGDGGDYHPLKPSGAGILIFPWPSSAKGG